LPTIISPEEVPLYTFKEFAAQCFEEQKQGFLKKKSVTVQQLLSFSNKPLTAALCKAAQQHNKIAVEISTSKRLSSHSLSLSLARVFIIFFI